MYSSICFASMPARYSNFRPLLSGPTAPVDTDSRRKEQQDDGGIRPFQHTLDDGCQVTRWLSSDGLFPTRKLYKARLIWTQKPVLVFRVLQADLKTTG